MDDAGWGSVYDSAYGDSIYNGVVLPLAITDNQELISVIDPNPKLSTSPSTPKSVSRSTPNISLNSIFFSPSLSVRRGILPIIHLLSIRSRLPNCSAPAHHHPAGFNLMHQFPALVLGCPHDQSSGSTDTPDSPGLIWPSAVHAAE